MSVLADGRAHSTRDLIRRAEVCAVNSCIAELRANGAAIDGRWEQDRLGRRVFVYRLKEAPKDA